MNKFTEITLIILVAIIIFVTGFIFGSKYYQDSKPESVTTTITYVRGDTVRIKVPEEKLVPQIVEVPKYIKVPVDTDSIYAIFKDYETKRQYHLDFSNDTVGQITVDAEVYQNKLIASESFIRPLVKTVEKTEIVTKTKFLQGYVTLGTSVHNFNTQRLSGGVEFKERFDVGATVIRYEDKFTYTVDFGIKF